MTETLLTQPDGATPPPSTVTEPTTPAPTEPVADKSLLTTPAAPEKYDFTAPEGYEIDPAVVAEATPILRELGLDQAGAQRLMDFYVAKANDAAQAPIRLWENMQKDWVTEIKADPDLGPKLDSVRTTVAKAIDGLGDPKLASAFREAMDLTGAGNNPAFIRAFYRLAQKVTEGTPVKGNGPSALGQTQPGQRRDLASAMYPGLPQG